MFLFWKIIFIIFFLTCQEEGSRPGNRLSRFAALVRDKGGLFSEALLEAKDGTLLAPSDEAFERTGEIFLLLPTSTVDLRKFCGKKLHSMCFDETISF